MESIRLPLKSGIRLSLALLIECYGYCDLYISNLDLEQPYGLCSCLLGVWPPYEQAWTSHLANVRLRKGEGSTTSDES